MLRGIRNNHLPLACLAVWPSATKAIPADLVTSFTVARYWYWPQKLAYLYGWPDLLEEGEVDRAKRSLS